MGLDGTKILDGDTAWCEYNHFVDLYDEGYSFEQLRAKFPFIGSAYENLKLDKEIYVTSIGLAYWEVGMLTEQDLAFIKR